MQLAALLHKTFGFSAFRTNQEAVCRAATDGRDVLLVMPTGAGKSLCYQLPAIARGGTALVISPLIALMDDQASKLSAAGLKVARIHSGLDREQSRQACRDYLDGNLQFLFIAPERMRVPGFPEMLARRKPALIAIDEAHCISAWGHDFRPDYRTLGDYLPSLRPAPIIALTATATPAVQRDIVAQLKLDKAALFIHGFRRDNLHIEVVEMSKPKRNEFAAKLLSKPENRPAIVYAPSRKSADDLASMLGGRAAAYHAGLEPSVRERVQRHFQTGKLEVVVATIAFGMGIDKADVRTVLHIALPASVEAYYQEIGRAGRDGLPSRTILLHSFVDRKIHETFLERDYPPATDLERVAKTLTPDFQEPEPLWQKLRMSADIFQKAVEKLASQGAAQIDMNGLVRSTGSNSWRGPYEAQVAHRRGQIEAMVSFAESSQCRMTGLIRHFGDTADSNRACGHCDVCAPGTTAAQSYRTPDADDLRHLAAILLALEDKSRSTGKLHSELAASALRGTPAAADRRTFDTLLDALVRAGFVDVTSDTFTNGEGNQITYKKAALTYEGREAASNGSLHAPDLLIKDAAGASFKSTKSGAKSTGTRSAGGTKAAKREAPSFTPAQKDLEARLREWRKAEAAKTRKPPFLIFSDSSLENIVVAAPRNISSLLQVNGIGPEKADRYGAAIIALCTDQSVPGEYGAPPPKPSASRPAKRAKPEAERPTPSTRAAKPRQDSFPTLAAAPSEQPTRPSRPRVVDEGPTYTRPRAATPEPADPLTPEQQLLDQRLRDWRKEEAERLGLPQFFVLGSSALRSIVLERPRTLAQLQKINGIGLEKVEKYGPGILQVCNP
ncbi:MAG TPA: RecQ family ATP-dependent DNA helicase [Granulicella sp.]|nr:RecQ family ATP-dependent DNA helicase [Granulicella sp.]